MFFFFYTNEKPTCTPVKDQKPQTELLICPLQKPLEVLRILKQTATSVHTQSSGVSRRDKPTSGIEYVMLEEITVWI